MGKFDWGIEVVMAALLGGGFTWLILSSVGMPSPLLFICCLIGASVSFWADNLRKKKSK
jgi:hypothetical protein